MTSVPVSSPDGAKQAFPPVVDHRTRVVILGSLPGEASLAQGRYYANPRNQFWRLLEGVTGRDLVRAAYEERLARLLAAGIGLWDVIASAHRAGSLDANIQGHQARDLRAFAASLPALRALAFNGGKAAQIGRAQFAAEAAGPQLLTLPSSSPAYAAPFERKLAAWNALRTRLA
ncbi:MAG: DNA-deoxyinosine glycosylase [Pseudomonadota bacterium]